VEGGRRFRNRISGGEGFLQAHDAGTGEIAPKGIRLCGGEGFEVLANLGNIGRKQGQVFTDALAESLYLTGISAQVGECELLGLVFKLQLDVGPRDGEAQQWGDGVGKMGDVFLR
jgi:hypothetical protein